MTNVDTLREKVEAKIPKKEKGNKLICHKCGREVKKVAVYGDRWLCVDCERELCTNL